MARQPICDIKGNVMAYELLFRNEEGHTVGDLSPQQEATALVHTLVDIGLDKLVGNLRAFVNVPTILLQSDVLHLLPAGRVVLEILETVDPTQENVEAIRALRKRGYVIALDDFIFDGSRDSLLPEAQIVKVEFPACDFKTLPRHVQQLKRLGTHILAEKVETRAQFSQGLNAGFQYFQGYFFAEPELVHGQTSKPDISTLMQLFQELQNPDISVARIEQLLSADVRLTHQLLRVARTAAIGMGSGVTSVRAAVMALGCARLSTLIGLMLMSEKKGARDQIVGLGMVRAKLCEEVARHMKFGEVERHFTVGLLSVLDAVYNRPLSEVIATISLAPDLQSALLVDNDPSPLGITLRAVKGLEKGQFDLLHQNGVTSSAIASSHKRALEWAAEVQSQLAG